MVAAVDATAIDIAAVDGTTLNGAAVVDRAVIGAEVVEVRAVDGLAVNGAAVDALIIVVAAPEETACTAELDTTGETVNVAALSERNVWLADVGGATVDGKIVDGTAVNCVVLIGEDADCTGVERAVTEVATVESTSVDKIAVNEKYLTITFR